MANRLVELISSQAAKYGNREAFRHKEYDTNKWITTTWNQFAEDVNVAAFAFEVIGIKENDRIAVFSQNRTEMIVTDFAAFSNRITPVPLYATASKSQVEYIVKDADICAIFVGDQSEYAIAREVIADCGILKHVISYDKSVVFDKDDNSSISFSKFMELGRAASQDSRNEVARRTASGQPEDIACLIYTSGTTGEPKGVMITHSNVEAQLDSHSQRLTFLDDSDISITFLPMSHIFERMWVYLCMYLGISTVVNQNPRLIQEILPEVNPTLMCSVPRFWEKVYAAVKDKIRSMPRFMRLVIMYALKVGRFRNIKCLGRGKRVPLSVELQYKLFDKLIFAKLRRAIGVEHGKLFPTAGAAISDTIVIFLKSVGINIMVGYGLSETTATVSCFPNVGYRIGSIGTKLDSLEVKIDDNNEILVRGASVMKGYYNKPKETAEAFTQDGFFRTGDAGKIDENGNLIMTERLKDLFKTSNGKYIAPQALETRLGEDKYIEQVAVIGDQRKYVTAIIIPAYEALKEYAAQKKIQYNNIDDLVKNSEIYKMLESRINNLQKGFASFEQIKKFTVLPHAFSMETGELTNTLKIRRPIINKLYRKEINAMYA